MHTHTTVRRILVWPLAILLNCLFVAWKGERLPVVVLALLVLDVVSCAVGVAVSGFISFSACCLVANTSPRQLHRQEEEVTIEGSDEESTDEGEETAIDIEGFARTEHYTPGQPSLSFLCFFPLHQLHVCVRV